MSAEDVPQKYIAIVSHRRQLFVIGTETAEWNEAGGYEEVKKE